MRVIIDKNAGPCGGVKRAIRLVEEELAHGHVSALGEVIHNQAEIDRLAALGLETIDQESVAGGDAAVLAEQRVFVRTHGITKELSEKLVKAGALVCDGTCPTVRKIQKMVESYFQQGFKIFIVGKPDHPEVIGLNGYCDNQAVIIKSIEEVEALEFPPKTLLISQTTVARDKFLAIQEKILQIAPHVTTQDTTCRQVNNRHENIRNFAAAVDVVLLVGGKKSSNTRVLFDIAKQRNPKTFWIESPQDIDKSWLGENLTIGITGSASTPMWQLSEIHDYLARKTIH